MSVRDLWPTKYNLTVQTFIGHVLFFFFFCLFNLGEMPRTYFSESETNYLLGWMVFFARYISMTERHKASFVVTSLCRLLFLCSSTCICIFSCHFLFARRICLEGHKPLVNRGGRQNKVKSAKPQIRWNIFTLSKMFIKLELYVSVYWCDNAVLLVLVRFRKSLLPGLKLPALAPYARMNVGS